LIDTLPNNFLAHDDLLAMVTGITNPDLRQDTMVALLEGQPATLDEAQSVISRARHRHEWRERQERRRTMTIEGEPAAEQGNRSLIPDHLRTVLDALDTPDRRILYLRFIANLSAKETGVKLGISQPTLRKHTEKAIAAAREVAQRLS
jgi:RNA polymerase sigma factor (sigma-70 family)